MERKHILTNLSYHDVVVQSSTLPYFYLTAEDDLKLSWIKIIHMRKSKALYFYKWCLTPVLQLIREKMVLPCITKAS